VIGCVPIVRVDVAKTAMPAVLIVPVPSMVVPSTKVIEPVAPAWTEAENVTDWLLADGFTEDDKVTTVTAFPTITTVGGEVAELLFASPDVVAVMELVPWGSDGIVIVATPPIIGAVPNGVEPSENVIVPVTPGGTVSVIVSGVLGGRLGDETTGGGRVGVSLLTICVRGAEAAGLLFVSPP
jgi:hypothetical protein